MICAIGKTAGVVVADDKFASAHDLRRAFGYRWAKVLMPKILQELMRHGDIKTTMQFYVGQMAHDAADQVWQTWHKFGNASGNTSPENQSKT